MTTEKNPVTACDIFKILALALTAEALLIILLAYLGGNVAAAITHSKKYTIAGAVAGGSAGGLTGILCACGLWAFTSRVNKQHQEENIALATKPISYGSGAT